MVLLDLLHIQRAGFFTFLKSGISKELSQLNINIENTRLQVVPFSSLAASAAPTVNRDLISLAPGALPYTNLKYTRSLGMSEYKNKKSINQNFLPSKNDSDLASVCTSLSAPSYPLPLRGTGIPPERSSGTQESHRSHRPRKQSTGKMHTTKSSKQVFSPSLPIVPLLFNSKGGQSLPLPSSAGDLVTCAPKEQGQKSKPGLTPLVLGNVKSNDTKKYFANLLALNYLSENLDKLSSLDQRVLNVTQSTFNQRLNDIYPFTLKAYQRGIGVRSFSSHGVDMAANISTNAISKAFSLSLFKSSVWPKATTPHTCAFKPEQILGKKQDQRSKANEGVRCKPLTTCLEGQHQRCSKVLSKKQGENHAQNLGVEQLAKLAYNKRKTQIQKRQLQNNASIMESVVTLTNKKVTHSTLFSDSKSEIFYAPKANRSLTTTRLAGIITRGTGEKKLLSSHVGQSSCFRLVAPKYTPREAILHQKSWSCKIVVKVLFTVRCPLPSTMSSEKSSVWPKATTPFRTPEGQPLPTNITYDLVNCAPSSAPSYPEGVLPSSTPTGVLERSSSKQQGLAYPLGKKMHKEQGQRPKGKIKKLKNSDKYVSFSQELFLVLGELPLMTKRGHFIIHGSPRVILSQLVRTPGIYFSTSSEKEKNSQVDCVPEQGPWLCIYKNSFSTASTEKSKNSMSAPFYPERVLPELRSGTQEGLTSKMHRKQSQKSCIEVSYAQAQDADQIVTNGSLLVAQGHQSNRIIKLNKTNLDISSYFCYTKQFSSLPFSLIYSNFKTFELHSQFTDQTLLLTKLKALEKIRYLRETITTLLAFTWKKRIRKKLQKLYTKKCLTATQQFEKTKLLFRLKKKLILGSLGRKSLNEKLGVSNCIDTWTMQNAYNFSNKLPSSLLYNNVSSFETSNKFSKSCTCGAHKSKICSPSAPQKISKESKKMYPQTKSETKVFTHSSTFVRNIKTFGSQGLSKIYVLPFTPMLERSSAKSLHQSELLACSLPLKDLRSYRGTGAHTDWPKAVAYAPVKEQGKTGVTTMLWKTGQRYTHPSKNLKFLKRYKPFELGQGEGNQKNKGYVYVQKDIIKEQRQDERNQDVSSIVSYGYKLGKLAVINSDTVLSKTLSYLLPVGDLLAYTDMICAPSVQDHQGVTKMLTPSVYGLTGQTPLGDQRSPTGNKGAHLSLAQVTTMPSSTSELSSGGHDLWSLPVCFLPARSTGIGTNSTGKIQGLAKRYDIHRLLGKSPLGPMITAIYDPVQQTPPSALVLPDALKEQGQESRRNQQMWLNSNILMSQDLALIVNLLDGSKALSSDDIDDLNNQRVITSSAQIQQQLRTGCFRFRKMFIKLVRESWGVSQTITDFLNGALREFFGSNPLSQFLDQTNPLAEITHKRRISKLGTGGIQRESATLKVRTIHSTYFGRICPIETPEGINAGLVNSLTCLSRVNSQGQLVTPLSPLLEKQMQSQFYFYSNQEQEPISTTDTALLKFQRLPNQFIGTKNEAQFQQLKPNNIRLRVQSDLQTISLATALIPFLAYDDANRALMGSNMQRQAVPLLIPERPIIRTGLEALVISESGHSFESSKAGFISYASAQFILISNGTLNRRLPLNLNT